MKTMYCPRCSTLVYRLKMRQVKHPHGIILDVCDKCGGMWVDGNEIDILFNRKVSNNKKFKKISKRKGGKK